MAWEQVRGRQVQDTRRSLEKDRHPHPGPGSLRIKWRPAGWGADSSVLSQLLVFGLCPTGGEASPYPWTMAHQRMGSAAEGGGR